MEDLDEIVPRMTIEELDEFILQDQVSEEPFPNQNEDLDVGHVIKKSNQRN